MADVYLMRGGDPDFKGWMCEGQFQEYTAPLHAPQYDHTPPFNTHADGAYGQGYLNLHYPLVPNLMDTTAHRFMQTALKPLSKVGDIAYLNWVPTRSFVKAMWWEVRQGDKLLNGVYVKPCAFRFAPDFPTDPTSVKRTRITAFDDELAAAGIEKFPLGVPGDADQLYGFVQLAMDPAAKPSTLGHNLVKRDAAGKITGPYDDYFGIVHLGLEVVEGDPEQIASIWKSNVALYVAAKLLAFECPTQIG